MWGNHEENFKMKIIFSSVVMLGFKKESLFYKYWFRNFFMYLRMFSYLQ